MADEEARSSLHVAFEAVSTLVKSWKLGDYVHHVRHSKDKGGGKQEFVVIFSVPAPTKPVVEQCAYATFTVDVPEEEEAAPKVTYKVETQQQKLDGYALPIRKAWLDAAVRRKRRMVADTTMFTNYSKLPPPQAFIPGQYKADLDIVGAANAGYGENEERLLDAMAELGDAADVAMRNYEESVHELEQLLVQVFTDADADGNGYLDPTEFSNLLDTAELGLDGMEKKQLMMFADLNGDGKIEYAEFASIGADVIQTMRLRKENSAEEAAIDAKAELEARKTIHSLGVEEVTALLLETFKSFDADGSGRLERNEIEKALQALTLGNTKLTKKEIRMIMMYIDEDESGTLEYNEFAPLMFNWMIEALKLGFLQSESNELQEYLYAHCSGYGDGSGKLPYHILKQVYVHTAHANSSSINRALWHLAPFAHAPSSLSLPHTHTHRR